MKEVNLEYGRPTVADAMALLKQMIKNAKQDKTKVLVFIHGYGSSGKGGAICKSARQWLKAQERNGTIKAVIFGEDFDMFNSDARELSVIDKDLKNYYGKGNNGITVVRL